MTELLDLVEFYKRRLDLLDGDDEFSRGAYTAYSIAMIKTRELVWSIMEEEKCS